MRVAVFGLPDNIKVRYAWFHHQHVCSFLHITLLIITTIFNPFVTVRQWKSIAMTLGLIPTMRYSVLMVI